MANRTLKQEIETDDDHATIGRSTFHGSKNTVWIWSVLEPHDSVWGGGGLGILMKIVDFGGP